MMGWIKHILFFGVTSFIGMPLLIVCVMVFDLGFVMGPDADCDRAIVITDSQSDAFTPYVENSTGVTHYYLSTLDLSYTGIMLPAMAHSYCVGGYVGGHIPENFLVDDEGPLPTWDNIDHDDEDEVIAYQKRKANARHTIKALWAVDGYSWTYETDIPHATFEVVEGDEKYCRGLVFYLSELTKGGVPNSSPK